MTATYSLMLILGSHFIVGSLCALAGYWQGYWNGRNEAAQKMRGMVRDTHMRLFTGRR